MLPLLDIIYFHFCTIITYSFRYIFHKYNNFQILEMKYYEKLRK